MKLLTNIADISSNCQTINKINYSNGVAESRKSGGEILNF